MRLVVVVFAGLFAGAAHADCALNRPAELFPFEGRVVPPNVELRFESAVDDFVLRGPTGDETLQPTTIGGSLGLEVRPSRPLARGPHQLERVTDGRVVEFFVDGDDDEEDPAPPTVTAERRTVAHLAPPYAECDRSQSPTDVIIVDVEADDDVVAFRVDGEAFILTPSRFAETSFEEPRGGNVSYDLVVRDFAGNVSEPTTVQVWSGCAGGCASSSALPMSSVLLLLLSRRRRLRTSCGIRSA